MVDAIARTMGSNVTLPCKLLLKYEADEKLKEWIMRDKNTYNNNSEILRRAKNKEFQKQDNI
jgi:hypothetical protein